MSDDSQLWQIINEIREKVARIDESLSERCSYRELRIAALERKIDAAATVTDTDDIEKRVRSIEHRLWFAVGAASGISSLCTLLITIFMK